MEKIRNGLKKAIPAFLLMFAGNSLLAAKNSTEKAVASSGVDMTAFWILVVIAIFLVIAMMVLADIIKNLIKNHDLLKNGKKGGGAVKSLLLLIGLAGLPFTSFGQTGDAGSFIVVDDTAFWFMVVADAILLGIVIYLLSMLRGLIKQVHTGVADVEEGEKVEGRRPSRMKKMMKNLTDSTPVEKEEEILLAHEHDGIQELDNNLPPWWKWMFYISIIFSFGYLLHYHVLGTGDLQEEEYRKSVKQAEAQVAAYLAKKKMNVDENNVTMVEDDSRIKKGKSVFQKNCVSCHGKKGGGGIGPNLTDKYWIHGGSIKDVFSTIKYGVPSQGMQSWEGKISPVQIQNVASFIKTLQGTNPPNGKEPEGDIYKPEGGASKDSTAADSGSKSDTVATSNMEEADTVGGS